AQGDGARFAFPEAGNIEGAQPGGLAPGEAGREDRTSQYEGEGPADDGVDALDDTHEERASVVTARRRFGHVVHGSPAESGAMPPAPTVKRSINLSGVYAVGTSECVITCHWM